MKQPSDCGRSKQNTCNFMRTPLITPAHSPKSILSHGQADGRAARRPRGFGCRRSEHNPSQPYNHRQSRVRAAAVRKSVSLLGRRRLVGFQGSHRSPEPEVRASAVPAAWTAHSRVARNIGTSWRSYPGSVQRVSAASPLLFPSTNTNRRTAADSPLQTSPAAPVRIRLRKGSASKVAEFYAATRDRVMPPLRG
jgi:hypothetical protein